MAAANKVRIMRFKLIENNRLDGLILCNKSTRSSHTADEGKLLSGGTLCLDLQNRESPATGYTAQFDDWFLQQNISSQD